MKTKVLELNSIFSVAEEMVKDNGEDCFYYDVLDNRFIIAAFDGCGGSGSKKYQNYSGKTGAYIASRAVCGGVQTWFCKSGKEAELQYYIHNALSVCKKYADKVGRIMGSLGKDFPTTVAVITGELNNGSINTTCFWAGDSRCYMLDSIGLHQLTADDLDGQDAMSNLTSDGVMTNVVNASTSFQIHSKKILFNYPCILLTATDGCFGYLNSPMEFEYLLLDSLIVSNSLQEWKIQLNERMHNVAGDDYTLCISICGFDNFEELKQNFINRNEYILKKYIHSKKDINDLWENYKEEYSKFIK